MAATAVMEALGHGCSDSGFVLSVATHLFAALMPLAGCGSEEQKRWWLPPPRSGRRIAADAGTEPEAGSDTSVCASAPGVPATTTCSAAPSAAPPTPRWPTGS